MPQSHIPVKAPRPSQSSLPSSLSTPSLGLAPSSRLLAVSGSPTHPPPNSSPSGSSGFRSFRSLLSFGPGKSNTTPSNPPSSAGPSRTSFSVLRKSTNGERSVSAPQLPTPRSQEDLPVLAIELSHRVDEPLIDNEELNHRLLSTSRTPENTSPVSTFSALSSRSSLQATDIPATPPTAFGASELSTIIEAETSGISKHLPGLDDSLDIRTTRSSASRTSPRSPRSYASRQTALESNDTSALDLSTSNVTNEVLAALSGSGPKDGWLNGVVLEEGVGSSVDGEAGNASFNLGSLDPDLAALLSPNRLKEPEPALLVSIGAVSPPLPTPPLPDTRRNTPDASPRMSVSELESRTVKTSPVLAHRSAAVRNPPLTRSGSMPQASSSRLVPQSSVPRLTRSTQQSPINSPLPSPTRLSESGGRPSLQLPRRRQSPLLNEATLPPRPSSAAGTESENCRSAASRLATPARHLAAVNSARATSRLVPSPQSSPGYDGSDSASSRSPTTSTGRRAGSVRPSLDGGSGRPRLYGRDRSASLAEGSNADGSTKRPVDWLGPRTAKAFAAAGLLDGDREKDSPGSSSSRPGSRFGYSSTRSDRDFRSQYAPSRAGFSDASSPSATWRRRSGSISRTVASSEAVSSLLGTPYSDSASTPRTTYSGTSTAATSISGASSVQRQLQDELSSMQEKHSLETGALLSALADSQRTSRMLREENVQLRDRLHRMEEQLAAAREELHRQQFNPPMTSTLGRNTFHRFAGQSSVDARRPYTSHSRLQTLLEPDLDHEKTQMNARADAAAHSHASYDAMPKPMPSNDASSYRSAHSRRYSASSSIFPAPPSNMTMLTNETGAAMPSSSPPPSPTLVVGRPVFKAQGGHHRTTSSVGNISPTTANFSILTGSPGSLHLRPEHEELLGDMPTLHLCEGDYDPDSYS